MSALRVAVFPALLLLLPALALGQGAGIAPDGSKGRLHVVKQGDTLWDITATYLGTPWIWPSVWIENDIQNPHRIYPGDLIWIADGKMRKVTPEEAAALLAGSLPGTPGAGHGPGGVPAALEEDPFASLDVEDQPEQKALRYTSLDQAPFVSADELETSASVLGSHDEHYWLSQEQVMIVSAGEGQVQIGDRFAVYRVRRRVLHPATGESVGYFIEVVGRAEISEIHPESSFAKVTVAYAEIEPGDRLMPYRSDVELFTPVEASGEVNGTVVAQQPHRLYGGETDLVILDRGSDDGVVRGRELVLYRGGRLIPDPVSGSRVMVPDDVLGRALVLKSDSHTALALITQARTEITAGDLFRSER